MNNTSTDEGVSSFYPAMIPAEEGHPTTAKFQVVATGDERGQGLKSKVAFQKNERVAVLSGVIVNHTTLDTIQITSALFFADRWFCRFLLHSCDPNLAINVGRLEINALRDIAIGEYLAIDYANTDDAVASQFACNCGAPNCRGWITGRTEKISEEGRRFLALRSL